MSALSELSRLGMDYILLLFLRVTGVILSSPLFSRRSIPNMAKICYCLALTYFFMIQGPPAVQIVHFDSPLMLVLLCAKEFVIGMVLGGILTLFFDAVYVAGQMMDVQIGFGMANVYDPQTNSNVPVMGNMLSIMCMLVFLSQNGHQKIIAMMNLAVWEIPIGGVNVFSEIGLVMAELFCTAFVLAIRMALPLLAAGLILEIILGVVIRAVPQMNMFVVGMPLKVIVGFVILIAIMPIYGQMFSLTFDTMFAGIETIFAGMAA
ncbi:MAG: flagellar biosynthetic protein FliR [Eubacteriales bacterium]|nr:flagellar biosynthetic protein FliR [Eubacteriales bacterium]